MHGPCQLISTYQRYCHSQTIIALKLKVTETVVEAPPLKTSPVQPPIHSCGTSHKHRPASKGAAALLTKHKKEEILRNPRAVVHQCHTLAVLVPLPTTLRNL
ncbi:unnamed protein product [Cercospora beticola]|nr:unnamed protein product [Cercospora beticola]